MSLPLSVLSQSGPPKSVGGGGSGVGGVVYHTSTGQYIGVATFFFFFFLFFFFLFWNPGLNWTKNRLRMVSKVRNVRLGVFSGGGCHHPNSRHLCLRGSNSEYAWKFFLLR